jgi:tetratricopeptide (TPR) repeat protein
LIQSSEFGSGNGGPAVSYKPELRAAPKTDRYTIVSLLGCGGTSLVYKAFDREKKILVALKSIKFPDQDGIYRIKQEFRFFRDFYHQNIVGFYDLHVETNTCFYTMELIEGADFVSFVRIHDDSLRVCFTQLVDALVAVHGSGRLHRDLKPSNILVDSNGRTVLLDFGLSTETRSTDSIFTKNQLYAGTPAYMAPELLAGEQASAASDLYALGVVLYESLTGRRPFPNLSPIARYEAQKTPPPPPHSAAANVPEDLSALALLLLSFDWRDRPRLSELTRFTEGSETRTRSSEFRPHVDRLHQPFVGRDAEMARLERAVVKTMAGHCVSVHVSGVSGVGKTTLIERFLSIARDRFGALALRSRCHHQESVRFNAVDGLVDMLSRQLINASEERLAQIVPDDLPALTTMFPVLGRIPWPNRDIDQDSLLSDPHSLVRQAIGAMRQLFRLMATGRPLILWIDDLQWSDEGSLPLLRDFADAGGDKPILTVFSYRTEDIQPNSVATALGLGIAADSGIEIEHLVVQPLGVSAVGTLLKSLVDDRAAADRAWVDEVTVQSAGLPFFVFQFAAFQRSRSEGEATGIDELNAAGVLKARLRALPSSQRTVLEIVSVAGRPLAEETLVQIITCESASGREIYQLLNQNLLRKAEANGRPAVETYHDRIRTAVLDSLDPEIRKTRHSEIANQMARGAVLDHAQLVEHFLGAGDAATASEHAILAGRKASERLAFNQAAEFLSLAARLRDPLEGGASLTLELADALANAGRSSEAADVYLRAACANEQNRPAAALCEMRAAQQLVYSGRLTEGLQAHHKLFANFGIAFPTTVRGAQRMSIINRALFAIGVWRLKVRATKEGQRLALVRIDTLWEASMAFMMLDFVVGDAMFTCFMREVASLGEPSRVLRALALEAAVWANVGRRWSVRRSDSLMHRAEDIGRRSTDPYDRLVLQTSRSGIAFVRGRWREAADLAEEAVMLHRRDCVRYSFEVPTALAFRVSALAIQGTIRQAKAETLEAIGDARRRGDIYVSRLFKSGYTIYIALAEDSPDTAIADAAVLLSDAPSDHFTSLHWSHFIATVNALVYAGRAWDAWALVQQQWTSIRATGFLSLGCIGAHLREIRARAALSAATAGSPPQSLKEWTPKILLRLAEEDARRISRTHVLSHAAATAAAIRSGIAALNSEAANRGALLESARQGFDQAGMMLHRAAAEMQLSTLPAYNREKADGAPGHQTMSDEGVLRPDHMSAFLMFVQ